MPPAPWQKPSAATTPSGKSINSSKDTKAPSNPSWAAPSAGNKMTLPAQNIQARVRAPGIWMIANIRNSLLLATSNRSEAAVGYATMDGDTSGGLSPIAGIDKYYLREWLRWMETTGLPESGPISALSHINVQNPTAELRPQSNKQTDEEDLMPYPVLDTMERAAIRDKKGPKDVLKVVQLAYPEFSQRKAQGMDHQVLQTLVPQPMETRTLRRLLPCRRPKSRSQNLVSFPHPLSWLQRGTRRTLAQKLSSLEWQFNEAQPKSASMPSCLNSNPNKGEGAPAAFRDQERLRTATTPKPRTAVKSCNSQGDISVSPRNEISLLPSRSSNSGQGAPNRQAGGCRHVL